MLKVMATFSAHVLFIYTLSYCKVQFLVPSCPKWLFILILRKLFYNSNIEKLKIELYGSYKYKSSKIH